MRYFKILTVAAVAGAWCTGSAFGQSAADYPNKPIRMIVAAAAGGASDIRTRLFTQKMMSDNPRQEFIIDDRPGQAGTEAYILTAKAPADGYTLLSSSAAFVYGPDLYPNFPDPIKDFSAISLATRQPYWLIINPAMPVKSVRELIAYAKSKPDGINIGVTQGGPTHVAAAYFSSMINTKLTIVPYKGSGPIMVDLMSGELQLTFGTATTILPQVKAGKVRALAVTTAKRSATTPELPTIAEAGVPGFEMSGWFGFLAPAGVPSAVSNKISAEIAKVAKSPDIVKEITEQGEETIGSTPQEFQAFIAAEVPRWHKVVKESGMKVE